MKGGSDERAYFNTLALKMQQGDVSAADKLYRDLVSRVFGFCRARVSDRAKAEDLTQDIFLKFVHHICSFDPAKGDFVLWFWTLARNIVIDSYRRERDIVSSDLDSPTALEEVPHSAQLEDHLQQKMTHEQLTTFIQSLSPVEQELFEFRYGAQLSYKEMESVLGKSEGSLRVAVSRLKEKIQEHFIPSNN